MAPPRDLSAPARGGIVLAFFVLLGLRVAIAGQLGLYADEAFYWQCSQRLDFAYSDLPPLTALLVRLGTEVAGHNPLGVRLPFLALGALLPLVVHRLAMPLVGNRDAWLAALYSLAIPGLGAGFLAIPDVPLVFLTALFLLGIERATRTGSLRYWILAGIAGGLGGATHYRFVLAPAAAAIFLLATSAGRAHLRTKGAWIALALLCLGLLPAAAYNALNDFAPLRHHVAGRHAGSVRPGAVWRFFAGQAVVASPLLFLACLAALKVLWQRARRGHDRAQLLAAFALVPFGLFLVASPLETTDLARHHWPISGYIPLLVVLPAVFRRLVRGGSRVRRAVPWLAPGLGIAVVLVAGVELATGVFGTSARRPFSGWSEVTAAVEAQRGERIVVADNFKLGANLAFESEGRLAPFVLKHPKNEKHGRASQYETWGIGEEALGERIGADALVVIQVKELRSEERAAWRRSIAERFESFESLGEVGVFVGGRSVRFELVAATGLLASQ